MTRSCIHVQFSTAVVNDYHWLHMYTYRCEQHTFSAAFPRASHDSWSKLWRWHWQRLARPAHRTHHIGQEITIKRNEEKHSKLVTAKADNSHNKVEHVLVAFLFCDSSASNIFSDLLTYLHRNLFVAAEQHNEGLCAGQRNFIHT